MISLQFSRGFPPIDITHNFAKSKIVATLNFLKKDCYITNTREHFLDRNLDWSIEETLSNIS